MARLLLALSLALGLPPAAGSPASDAATSLKVLGFALVHQALRPEEVLEIRKAVQKFRTDKPDAVMREAEADEGATPQTIPGALRYQALLKASLPLCNSSVLHAAFREFFQGESYRRLDHSDVGINRGVGWHKDTSPKSVAWSTSPWKTAPDGSHYQILKVGIYLQDQGQSDASALDVIPGSHLRSETGHETLRGRLTLKPLLGDVVVVDQRIDHRAAEAIGGQGVTPDRLLLAYAVGARNVFSEEHERGSAARQDKQIQKAKSDYQNVLRAEKLVGKLKSAVPQRRWIRACDGSYCCVSGGRGQASEQRLRPWSHRLSRLAHRYRRLTGKVPSARGTFVKHSYTEFYGPLLEPRRGQVRHVLELGGAQLEVGSVLMWRDFFPLAEVWGVAADASSLEVKGHDLRRAHFLQGDPNSTAFLADSLPNTTFDVLISSAGNDRYSQLHVLKSYRKLLRKGGLLVLEGVMSSEDADFITDGFTGDRNLLSVVDRRFGKPSFCDERLVLYTAP